MKRFWLPALGAVILAGGILASRPAVTAPAKGAGDTDIPFGYVDVQKVLQDSPALRLMPRSSCHMAGPPATSSACPPPTR